MNTHRYFLALLAVLSAILLGLALQAGAKTAEWKARDLPEHRRIARALGLTDLALWTEARYTRHPSQADFFSAFQDFPASFEHFPAGSLVAPPAALSRGQDALR
ncbi:MAG: hypothetical protein OHK006_25010 [Thermodesulfovibrionales bacterium]